MLRPGQVVFLCALTLLTLGVVMVQSAGMSVDPVEQVPVGLTPVAHDSDAHSFASVLTHLLTARPTIYMALAVLAMSAVSLFPIRRLAVAGSADGGRGLAVLGLGVMVMLGVLALSYVPGLGREVNGSQRWISLPLPGLRATSVQPSELVKWGLVVVLAVYCAQRAAMPSFFRGLLPGLIGVGLVAGAVAKEDLGTGVLIASSGGLVLIAAGARLWHFAMFIPPAIAGFIFLVASNPYRVDRIRSFIDPYMDPKGTGYHMIQSMGAVAGGEGFGRGLGFGLQKFGYLPEDTTDFLFAIICEELGIAGAAVVVTLFGAMLWAGLRIVRREESPVLKLAGLGVLSTIGLQALINLAVVTGLGPTKGIALPLVSSGGTGWILTAASLGLLVAMDRASRESEPVPMIPEAESANPEPAPQLGMAVQTISAGTLAPA